MNLRAANVAQVIIVLIVEDELLIREDIAAHFAAAGCTVLQAETGEEAIAICDSGARVDAVFTDVHLNGSASGWEVAETFRKARPGIPIVYASGNTDDRRRCVAESVFFSKPYRSVDILECCRKLCRDG
jgi:CheY-like chemotaxis protein